MRHAGMGWPNGPTDNAKILALPSRDVLLLGSEHWHHDQIVQSGCRVLFRGMARQGFRPAELGWDVRRYCDEITRDAVRVSEPITDFVAWNEWNLQDERGDQRPDFGDLTTLFSIVGAFQMGVIAELRRRPVTKGSRIHFGAWAPKDETDYIDHWRAAAEAADVIDVHAYGQGMGIIGHIEKYRGLFPGKPVEITEWHSDGAGADQDRETLALFANETAVHPDFRAYYFLWRWDSPPEHQRDLARAIAVEGNGERLALFRDPPTVEAAPTPAPEPQPVPEPQPAPTPEPDMPELPRGIDVSNNNGGIDWPAVAASGVQFAICKVSEGTWFRDGLFAMNWQGAKASGLIRGAYAFARPSITDPVAEADYFVDAIGLLGQSLEAGDLLALDLEDDRATGDLSGWTLSWLRRVEDRVGYKPLVYTSPGYAQAHGLANRPEIGDYGLWCASWGVPTPPQAPAPWDLVAIHQYAVGGPGSVPGVNGECDLNRFNGPIESLALYGKPAPAEPAPSPYAVGDGIAARMAEFNDSPACNERYVDGDWSEAMGASGRRYVYLKLTGAVHVYEPAA